MSNHGPVIFPFRRINRCGGRNFRGRSKRIRRGRRGLFIRHLRGGVFSPLMDVKIRWFRVNKTIRRGELLKRVETEKELRILRFPFY